MGENQDVIAIYSRKSRFTGKGESVGNQVELCRHYIATVYGEDRAEKALIFEDEGFSGGNLNRPGFQRMMREARNRRFRAVVVYRLDRISRSIGDFSKLIEELGGLEIDFVSIRESFDTSSPMGRAMMYIASVFSQLERETIAERIRDNMRELAKTGRWLGGVTPTGYTSESVSRVTVDGKSRKACKLRLVPEEAELVRGIFALYAETGSLAQTEAELLRRGARTKTGREFTRFSIKAILQNPVYLVADEEAWRYFVDRQAQLCSPPEAFDGGRGILAYHRTDQQKGKATVYLPVSQWIVAVGEHPGLIASRTWLWVQRSLERNRSKSYHSPRGNRALLTGLLWCSCGGRMYPKQTKRLTAEGTPAYTYVCKRKERSKGELCQRHNVNGNSLDEAVLGEIKRLEGDRAYLVELLGREADRFDHGPQARGSVASELRRQQAQLRRKMDALVDSLAELGDSGAVERVRERLEALSEQERGLKAQIARLEQGGYRDEPENGVLEQLIRQFLAFGDCVEAMTVEQRRELLRGLVQRVIWDGTRAHLILFGAFAGQEQEEKNGLPWAYNGLAEVPSGLGGAVGAGDGAYPAALQLPHWGEDSK